MTNLEPIPNREFLPVFSMDWFGLLRKIKQVEGNYGVLSPIHCTNNFLHSVRELGKPFFIDHGVFAKQKLPWHFQKYAEFKNGHWQREIRISTEQNLRQNITQYFERCDRFSPDYVFAPDVIGEPLLSLRLAHLSLDEYARKPRTYALIGVIQTGAVLYNWESNSIPQSEGLLPHYNSPRCFLASLISEYRRIGYQNIALGGLLQARDDTPTGLKFGLSPERLDELLAWSRPEVVLGGLALTRIEVLRKHKVWADSTNWLWWDARYDKKRFGDRDVMGEVLGKPTTFATN